MAQPSYAIEYLGAVEVSRGVAVTTASLLVLFPTATVVKLKCKSGANVSINGGVQFPIDYNDESYLTTGKTFLFDTDCVIVVGIYRAIT